MSSEAERVRVTVWLSVVVAPELMRMEGLMGAVVSADPQLEALFIRFTVAPESVAVPPST